MPSVINKKQLIHIACELVVFVALIFFFSNKTSKLASHIENLSHRLDGQQTEINRQADMIKRIESKIAAMDARMASIGQVSTPVPRQPRSRRRKSRKVQPPPPPPPAQPQPEPEPRDVSVTPPPLEEPVHSLVVYDSPSSESSVTFGETEESKYEDTVQLSEEEMDEIMSEELEELNQDEEESGESEEDDGIEEIKDDDEDEVIEVNTADYQ